MFKVLAKDADSRARRGVLETAHGPIETPAYAIVGTHGAVKTVSMDKVAVAGAQVLMMNTFHLWRDMGEEKLENFPGLHRYTGWDGPIMTDSGGFQVFSMGVGREHETGKIMRKERLPGETTRSTASVADGEHRLVRVTEEGVYFQDGAGERYLNAEKSIRIQEKLGGDIIFALDEPSSPLDGHEKTRLAMERTHRWAIHSLEAKTRYDQLLYGIIQGGPFEDLRKESAKIIAAMPFAGFAVGGAFGSSYGDTPEASYRELDWTIPLLPEEKPRHLLGLGRLTDVLRGVAAGIDTFDCVVPTREGRHGAAWTRSGRLDFKVSRHRADRRVIEEGCLCEACASGLTREEIFARLRPRDAAGRPAPVSLYVRRLLTLHNITFFNRLMADIRAALETGTFSSFKRRILSGIMVEK